MPGILGRGQPAAVPQQPNALQRFFTPERTLAFQGLGDILQGGTGQRAYQGLQQLQEQRTQQRLQQEGNQLLSGLLGGSSRPTMGMPSFGAPAMPFAQTGLPGVTTTPISDDPIITGAADAIARSEPGANPSLQLIRQFEGFREEPYYDVNAFRAGYGSDTITTPEGQVVPVTQGARVSREDAERDLLRRVTTEFAPRARAAVGAEVYDNLNPQQQAALNSITYNYGSLPDRVARVARTGDVAATAQAIAGLAGDNEGINANRRQQEAAIFAGGAVPQAGAQPQQGQISQDRVVQILNHPGIPSQTKQFVLDQFNRQFEQPDLPSSVQEYQFAQRQGFQGTFQDYQQQKAQAGATQVNVGPQGQEFPSPPKGMVYQRDPTTGQIAINETGLPTLVPLPGSPQAQEAEAAAASAAAGAQQTGRAADVVREDIGRIRKLVTGSDTPVTGLLGSQLAKVPGTPAFDAGTLIETVVSNIGFDRLQQMREASPTGGALGAVSERELSNLQSVLGSLKQGQSQEQFLANLDRLDRIYSEIQKKAAAYPNADQFGFGGGGEQDQGWTDVGGGIRIRPKGGQ